MAAMFRFLCAITCVSAGLPTQRSIVRDDGMRAQRGPDQLPAKENQSLVQEGEGLQAAEVQASGSNVTDPTPDDGTGSGGGGGATKIDVPDGLFETAEQKLKQVMDEIKRLAIAAANQQKALEEHRGSIRHVKGEYNFLFMNMEKKLQQMRTQFKAMKEGLDKAEETTFTGESGLTSTELFPTAEDTAAVVDGGKFLQPASGAEEPEDPQNPGGSGYGKSKMETFEGYAKIDPLSTKESPGDHGGGGGGSPSM